MSILKVRDEQSMYFRDDVANSFYLLNNYQFKRKYDMKIGKTKVATKNK